VITVSDNYTRIAKANLDRLYASLPPDLAALLPAVRAGDTFEFKAFGRTCRLTPQGIELAGSTAHDPVLGILVSLYALGAVPDALVEEPFKAFKEFPGSTPYVGAFASHTEAILVPHVPAIREAAQAVLRDLEGRDAPPGAAGDFSFVIRPLPKISLCYLFYEADEDFPASATCLFSANAASYLPVDGLADVGEYTSKTLLSLIGVS
jgi:hypothetical protein